jgi:hypothetical protein
MSNEVWCCAEERVLRDVEDSGVKVDQVGKEGRYGRVVASRKLLPSRTCMEVRKVHWARELQAGSTDPGTRF